MSVLTIILLLLAVCKAILARGRIRLVDALIPRMHLLLLNTLAMNSFLVCTIVVRWQHSFLASRLILPENLVIVVLVVVQVNDVSWDETLSVLTELLEAHAIDVFKS